MNLSAILPILADLPAYQQAQAAVSADKRRHSLGLPPFAHTPVLAQLITDRDRPVLLVVARIEMIPIWQQALEAWLPPARKVLRFPEPTPLPYDRGPWSARSIQGRLAVLTALMAEQHPLLPSGDTPPIIITSARALLQKTTPRQRFLAATRTLRAGQIIDLEQTVAGWLAAGYEAVSVVERPGQFSQRGGILDLYPTAAPFPVRIELFGDEIESIRHFDPTTQRSLASNGVAELSRVVIPPAREALPGQAQALGVYLEAEAATKPDDLPAWQDDIPALAAGAPFPNLEYYLPLLYGRPASLLDYMPPASLLVVDDWGQLTDSVAQLETHAAQMAGEQESLPPDFPRPLFGWEELTEDLADRPVTVLGDSDGDQPSHHPQLAPDLADAFRPGPRYGGQMRPFLAQLRHARHDRERTIVVSRQAQRLAELWRRELKSEGSLIAEDARLAIPVEIVDQLPEPSAIQFVQGSLAEGFVLERADTGSVSLSLLTDAEIFGWKRPAPRRRRAAQAIAPETPFADIQPGDHVVHLDYGIGLFMGLVVRFIGGMEREYLQLKYGGNDILYVPVHHADRLSKWIGPDGGEPQVHRLGEKSWKSTKTKAMRAVSELADELIALYAVRETIPGHAFSPDDGWQAELEASFPYQETDDQLRAIAEVKRDMERANPMDRLICGDVGYGKTEVALRAAFKAVMDGKQVCILVPTTILAQQHYTTFRQRLQPFPVSVEMLSRFRSAGQQAKIIQKLRAGTVDIIIGTHRLLSDDVSFKDLGLLVIDEEQRFGVAHKERLKQLRTEVDVLTMTATPIPRTLYMSLTGVRDISNIDTAPAERLPVQTYVGEMEDSLLKRAIRRELDRGGQIFIVHNRVQTIKIVAEQIRTMVPEATVAIGHGQMAERELEATMGRFIDGEVDILLSTTIIENGLDIPNANTLILDHAERFGLAQLYQLRGRVGRGAQRAYAYFFHTPWHHLTTDAQQRLEALAEHTDLGSGYQIAMRDLEIRGAGELLGPQQSGQIGAIGFDLYTKMLNRAVRIRRAAQRGEVVQAELLEDTMIDLPLATYIPTDYVPDGSLRLRLYRRMAGLDSLEAIDLMAEEMADRFGPIPDPIDNLLYQLRVKVLAMRAFVMSVVTEANQIRIRPANLENVDRPRLQRALGSQVRVSRTAIWLGHEMATQAWRVLLVQTLEKLTAYVHTVENRPAAATEPANGTANDVPVDERAAPVEKPT